MDIQIILVSVVVAAAVIYMGRMFYRSFSRSEKSDGCGCGCSGCSRRTPSCDSGDRRLPTDVTPSS